METPKILVVDDNAAFRQVVIAMLEGVAGECVECENGAQALECYEREQPDCVVMDLELKGMDGIETTRAILARHADARVFILSQHDDLDLGAAATLAGAIGYLAKEELPLLRGLLLSHLKTEPEP